MAPALAQPIKHLDACPFDFGRYAPTCQKQNAIGQHPGGPGYLLMHDSFTLERGSGIMQPSAGKHVDRKSSIWLKMVREILAIPVLLVI